MGGVSVTTKVEWGGWWALFELCIPGWHVTVLSDFGFAWFDTCEFVADGHTASDAQDPFWPSFCGGVISSACKSCALQYVHLGFRAALECNFSVSCRTAMCSLGWAALQPEGHECYPALCWLG